MQTIDPQDGTHPPFTWCFVDAQAAKELPDTISNPVFQLFPIYVTSPTEARWAKLHQTRTPTLIIMNPWTLDELDEA